MYYFAIGLIMGLYLYMIENIKSNSRIAVFILFIPFLYFYALGPALQYGVGTDYFTYKDMYKYGPEPRLLLAQEYGFYYLVEFTRVFKLGEQSMFVLMAIIFTILFFIILQKLKKYGYKRWLVFFLFFTITGIYFNQMNTMRQFVAILSTPILLIYLYEKKYLKSILISLFALSFHTTFIISLVFLGVLFFFKKINKKLSLYLFILAPIAIVTFFPLLTEFIFKELFPKYSPYLGQTDISILKIVITKVYYLPLLLLFWIKYIKDGFVEEDKFFSIMIVVFSLTAFSYLLDYVIYMHGRVFQLFYFFYIFPIYYLFEYYFDRRKLWSLTILSIYILVPFLIKILVIAESEYEFKSILFI